MGDQERRLYQNNGELAGTLIWQGAHISKRKYLNLKRNEKVIILQNVYKSHMELVLAKPALHNF